MTAGGDFIGRDQIHITIHQTLASAPSVELPASNPHLLNLAQCGQIEQTLSNRISKTIKLPQITFSTAYHP